MTIITPNQIFDLFAIVSCKKDLSEITDYIQSNIKAYSIFDLQLFQGCMNTLWDALYLTGK